MRWAFLLIGFLSAFPANTAIAAARPPDVLWICADDLTPEVCSAWGAGRAQTPHLARLVSGGLRFDRAFCNSPVCTASRQSFLTGRYPRSLGVTQLATPLPDSERTLAEVFGEHGYLTAAVGKMHFNSSLTHGFAIRRDLPDYAAWLAARGATPTPAGTEVLPPWRPFKDPAAVWLNAACRPVGLPAAEMAGEWLAAEAAGILRQPRDQPLFLMVSFYEPHSPFHFPLEFAGRHSAGEFTAPPVDPADLGQIPAIFRELSPADKCGIQAAYHTSVEYLDTHIGVVLDALADSGREQDTLVVFTSDHGYMLGQHGRFEKHCSFEPAVRTALALRFPGRIEAGQSTSALVELVDVAPTLCDLCGLGTEPRFQGSSLAALAEGRVTSHRDHVVVEYAENGEALIRTERYKLVYITGTRQREDGYTTGEPLAGRTVRLYDLEADPDERHDLLAAPDGGHRELAVQLLRQLADQVRATVRNPGSLPPSGDSSATLDWGLLPHDVNPP